MMPRNRQRVNRCVGYPSLPSSSQVAEDAALAAVIAKGVGRMELDAKTASTVVFAENMLRIMVQV
jgi:hypothetical protein